MDVLNRVITYDLEKGPLITDKDCSSKFRSKQSSNTVLCLLRNLLEQSLVTKLAFEWFLFLMN